jgi:hypothetical protein
MNRLNTSEVTITTSERVYRLVENRGEFHIEIDAIAGIIKAHPIVSVTEILEAVRQAEQQHRGDAT